MSDRSRRRTYGADEDGRNRCNSPRRSSISSLALPVEGTRSGMAASVNIGTEGVEFEALGVRISREGLFMENVNVSKVHPDDLCILSELGRGACSVVKQAQHAETREVYAVKIFSVFDRSTRAQLLKEIEILWGMDCPSLVRFVGGYLENGNIHIVLEYMNRGNLSDLIHGWKDVEYGEDLMAAVTFQMLWGLGYLHFENRLHRDIKPQNILLNSKGEVKLSDFGIARELEGEMDLAQTMVGTIRYMSPERLAGSGYGASADVWSLGVVLLEMAARRLPFDDMVSQIELHDKLEQERAVDDFLSLLPGCSTEFEEVLRGCLQIQPEKRLRPEELLELEWFRPFRRSAQEDQDCVSDNDRSKDHDQSCADENGARIDDAARSDSADAHATHSEALEGDTEAPAVVDGEQHDLDRAIHIMYDYISAAAEKDARDDLTNQLSPGSIGLGADSNKQYPRRRRFGGGSQLIRTMYSDSSSDGSTDENSLGQGDTDAFGIFDRELDLANGEAGGIDKK